MITAGAIAAGKGIVMESNPDEMLHSTIEYLLNTYRSNASFSGFEDEIIGYIEYVNSPSAIYNYAPFLKFKIQMFVSK